MPAHPERSRRDAEPRGQRIGRQVREIQLPQQLPVLLTQSHQRAMHEAPPLLGDDPRERIRRVDPVLIGRQAQQAAILAFRRSVMLLADVQRRLEDETGQCLGLPNAPRAERFGDAAKGFLRHVFRLCDAPESPGGEQADAFPEPARELLTRHSR